MTSKTPPAASSPANTVDNRRLPPVETRWKPGQSGNPSGRPKGSGRLSKALAHLLGERYPDDPLDRTYAEVISERIAQAAAKGDVAAMREIADRTEGKATQRIENVQLRERFDRMTEAELLRYAADGTLPIWWSEEGQEHGESN